ncbi:MAG: LexA family protein [Planctomycetota bacterium]
MATDFTAKQGIDCYTKVNRRPPSQADIQRYFRVSPPSVHQMILTLERNGLLSRTPGAARAIRVLLKQDEDGDRSIDQNP